jgi:outer membrane protein OmpA-like peptidoglycan-associated protein
MRKTSYHEEVSVKVSPHLLPRVLAIVVTAVTALGLSWGPGAAAADALKVQMVTRPPAGQAPKLVLTAGAALEDVDVELTRGDGKTVRARTGPLSAGATHEVALPADPGRHRYEGHLRVSQGGATQESPLRLETVVDADLRVQIDRGKIDLPGRRLEARLTRPAARVEIRTFDATGAPTGEHEQDLHGEAANEPLTVRWPATGAPAARIDLKFHDVDGFYTGVSLIPWNVYIPHEEVTFATDSAAIAAKEVPKLQASLALIEAALAKHRELGPIKLFVAGHTDTVGAAPYNLKLSQRRAQAIAAWFRGRGLRIPVYFEGFGEHAPAVGTPDGTDEPRNRRVDYILAVEEPALKTVGFRPSWKRLP